MEIKIIRHSYNMLVPDQTDLDLIPAPIFLAMGSWAAHLVFLSLILKWG